MYILNANFSINPKVGPLTDVKINMLRTLLNDKFPNTERPNENMILFKKGLDGLFIAPDQITFITQGNSEEMNVLEISETMKEICEVLNVSNRSGASIKFEGTEDRQDDMMLKTKEFVNQASEVLDASGVGFRFIINHSSFNGDVRIEPFVRDNHKLFYEVTLETTKVFDHSQLNDNLNEMFDYGTTKAKSAANTLIN